MIMMDKNEIRKQMSELRRQLTKTQIVEYSEQIIRRLYQKTEYQLAQTIYCYVSYREEVMTHQLIENALLQGKRVAVPKVLGKKMEFFYINGLQELQNGTMGILEPSGIGSPANDNHALMILPGLAFDRSYNRMGYGGGYYDKYITTHLEHKFNKFAVAFDFQIMEQIKTEEYDVKVDHIITPTQII